MGKVNIAVLRAFVFLHILDDLAVDVEPMFNHERSGATFYTLS